MHFDVRALATDDYAKWLADGQSGRARPRSAAYATLAKQSSGIKPVTYRAVDPKLFESIVNETAPPAKVPRSSPADMANRPTRRRHREEAC